MKENQQSVYKCEDVACEAVIHLPHPNQFTGEGVLCHQCGSSLMHKAYTDRQLFDQLCFFKKCFDLGRALQKDSSLGRCAGCGEWMDSTKGGLISVDLLKRRPGTQQTREVMDRCALLVDKFLAQNDFARVDLSIVFAPLFIAAKRRREKEGKGADGA